MKKSIILLLILVSANLVPAQDKKLWSSLIGSAYLENESYSILQRICDEAGGRDMGSPQNEKAMQIFLEEMNRLGMQARKETFPINAWFRQDDYLIMKFPHERKLRCAAYNYSPSTEAFEAEVIYASYGYESDYPDIDVKGKIVLVNQSSPEGKPALLRFEQRDIAFKKGARAILHINDKQGGQVLRGSATYNNQLSEIPAFNLAYEEGLWLIRLLEQKKKVVLEAKVSSFCKEIETANLLYTIPGKVPDKIVLGAHFDAIDAGQGAIDNGLGIAIGIELARLIKKIHPENYFTIEFVWFNGEEVGLTGSKKYMEMHAKDPIMAMLNMDMTGSPTGFNCMGFEEFKPFFEQLVKDLHGFDLRDGVKSIAYTNSDHVPFMLQGIPVLSAQAKLDENMYAYYHELGDSFDKVSRRYLSDASAILGIMLVELANREDFTARRLSKEETIRFLEKQKLDERLKKQKEWIF